jgi:hypothetical protein
MLPHEKELVQRLKDKPFALLGINSDGDATKVQQIMKEQGVTWRQSIQGSTQGPLAREWNVSSWPTIYIIDQKGIIRYKNLRDKAMEDAVVKLLAESSK